MVVRLRGRWRYVTPFLTTVGVMFAAALISYYLIHPSFQLIINLAIGGLWGLVLFDWTTSIAERNRNER